MPKYGTVGGHDGENTESRYRLTETATDSEAGQLGHRVRDGIFCRVAKPCLEEPDASIAHVRICRGAWAGNRPGLPDHTRGSPILLGLKGKATPGHG